MIATHLSTAAAISLPTLKGLQSNRVVALQPRFEKKIIRGDKDRFLARKLIKDTLAPTAQASALRKDGGSLFHQPQWSEAVTRCEQANGLTFTATPELHTPDVSLTRKQD